MASPTRAGIASNTEATPGGGGGGAPSGLPAVDGNDVMAYHSLLPGQKDVKGTPSIKRFVPSGPLLPKQYASMHPQPYEFWFASEANAALFDADPWKYIPAFGEHCTHGIASRGDLNASLLVQGRVAFTCVNTTEWVVRNGTLYMNSCGMYYDFIKDPDGDIAKASALWASWFGESVHTGPINDACFQDGGLWAGDPIGHLIPPHCVVNAQVQQHYQHPTHMSLSAPSDTDDNVFESYGVAQESQTSVQVPDSAAAGTLSPGQIDQRATEQLLFNATIPCDAVDRFVE